MEIVAELSCNHLGSLRDALEMIYAAKIAGADAVKFQGWHPDHMVVTRDYVLDSGPWKGRNLRELYEEAFTPWEWFPMLFDEAKRLGIDCFASVFDVEALAFLETLNCPRYKIASFEALDRSLLEAVAKTGKPAILSTGLLEFDDLDDAANGLYDHGATDVTLLKCVSEYPAAPETYNLRALEHLRDFAAKVGVSDHTLGDAVPVAAAALGADMLEKHLTLSRANGGPDAGFSIEPEELGEMVAKVRAIEAAMREPGYVNEPSEQSLDLCRSLWVVKPITAGTVIQPGDVISARPAGGLVPGYLPYIIGSVAERDYQPGQYFLP